jgi:arylsulfatase A-like enzyme
MSLFFCLQFFCRSCLLTALLLAALAPLHAAETPAKVEKPNLLVILADDMGWGDLRCHGNDKLDTPALDRLQSQSVELAHFHVSPVCSPTRSSLLTGRHHFRLRVLNTTSGLETLHGEEVTLAEALKPAGYVSGCFGKWHNGANHPTTARGQGFHEFFGFVGGFFSNYFDPELEHNGVTAARKGFITDVLADATMAFIEKHRAQPFFCYVPFNACHSPMQAPEDLFAKYSALGFEPKTAAVYAMIENLDANVGRILAKLDTLDLAENTLVMFASDNGPNTPRFNGGMRGGKGSLFEGGQRVPCFIRWPGKLEAGKRVPQIAQHVDVLPTLLDLAGVPLPATLLDLAGVPLPATPPLDGMSLAPLLRGENVTWPERLLFEVTGRGGKDGTIIPMYPGTVRSDTHRWVRDNKQEMLFDLRNDPGEKNNIAAQQPEIAVALSKAYDAWFADAIASTQGKVQRFPITLGEGTELLAPFATVEGGAKFFGQGWDNDWVVFSTPTATITWNLEVPQAGTYEVTALHTAQEPGGNIKITASEQVIETTLAAAHNPPEIPRPDLVRRWEVPDKVFAPLKLGTLRVSGGLQRLQINAAPGIEIQSLRLTRVEKTSATIRLPSIFSDHMVLQCDQSVPVWGWSEPGAKVTVEFAAQTKTATADAQGKWTLKLDPLAASAGSQEMRVSAAGGESRVIRDVIVGEVWLGSGQSNMEQMMFSQMTDETATAVNPLIRQFITIKRMSMQIDENVEGFWLRVEPGQTETMSAAGYYFSKSIHEQTQRPVGVIKAAWGGRNIESFISPAAHDSVERFKESRSKALENLKAKSAAFSDWLQATGRTDRPTADSDSFLHGEVSRAKSWVEVKDSGLVSDPALPQHGAFWLRKEIELSAEQIRVPQYLFLGFNSVDFYRVYLNGKLMEQEDMEDYTDSSGLNSRIYLMPKDMREGVNQLALRVFAHSRQTHLAWAPALNGKAYGGGWMARTEFTLPEVPTTPKKPLFPQSLVAVPGTIYNGMIHSLSPYALRGFLWYQGESNTRDPAGYHELKPLLISDWRRLWGDDSLPFYYCQLANWREKDDQPGESSWAELREAQSMTLSVPNTGMAVLIDTGESKDIHPQSKDIAGERLARIALAQTYGKPIPFSGPVYTAMKIEGSVIRLSFDHLGGGLVAKEVPATYDVMRRTGQTAPLVRNRPHSQLEGFAICGADRKWVWADAKIDGDTLLVWSDQVAAPVAVRYGWADNPTCNLYNAAGLPASPFRTDSVNQ